MGGLLGLLLLAACSTGTGETSRGLREPDGGSRLRVAAAAEASGQLDLALSLYRAAAEAEPRNPAVLARLASALSRSGNDAEAQDILDRALQQSPRDPALINQMGRLQIRRGLARPALETFGQLLAAKPDDAAALDGRGMAFDMLGQHAEAQASYRAALAASPGAIGPANNLGVSLLLAGRFQEAQAVLEPLARRPGATPRVATNLAIARAALGDQDATRDLIGDRATPADLQALLRALGNRTQELGRE
ncbi:tetratricopeptide repeat protein [Roseomonas sp. BN140053]|uniref:tetratricopeptide repeat protein n=1 Tax=Roseomonas sp. BN140053 TaxID=3391898 RepID=UPI0039EB2E1E